MYAVPGLEYVRSRSPAGSTWIFAPLYLGRPQSPRNAPVAQLDRANDFESLGREFEPLRARQEVTASLVFSSSVDGQQQTRHDRYAQKYDRPDP
jgi:hypothetical protein